MQSSQLFLLTLRQHFVALVIPDILLHGLNIRLFWYIADVLGNEFLDIHDRTERYCLFHHSKDLLIVHIPPRQHIPAIFLLRVIDLCLSVILLQKTAQRRNLHSLSVFNKTVLRQRSHINEKALLPASITAAIKNDTRDKAAARHIVLKLAGNVAGEIFPSAGIWVIFIHIRPQITIQRALRLFVGSLIKVAGTRFPQQNDLKGINYRRFSRAVFSGEKINIPHLDDFFAEIQPVNQQDLLQFLHRYRPPFAAQTQHRSTSR